MIFHPQKFQWIGIITLACLSTLNVSADSKGLKHDVTAKVIRSTETKPPLGQFGPNVELPLPMNPGSSLASQNVQRSINTSRLTGQSSVSNNVPMRITPTAPLRACVTYDLDNATYGMVNLSATGMEVLREHEGFNAAWGGAGIGTKYYYNTCADVAGGYVQNLETYLWNIDNNWQCVGYDQDPEVNVLSLSMTSHPVTEAVWGCFYSSDLQQLEIGTLDPMTMKRTGTVGVAEKGLYGMGFSSDNTLYGIDKEGVLYKVNTANGKYVKVAETGLKTDYNTTGTVDSFNDVFYYAVCPQGPDDDVSRDWALYSIDLKNNYKVEKCWSLRAELGGMYVANAAAKPLAPGAPVLNSVNFTDGNLSGIINFTAPNTLFNGDPVSGNLTYGILANDKVIAMGNVVAGEDMSVPVNLAKAGMYTIRVYVANTIGESPKSEGVSRWYGNGKPLAPTNVDTQYTFGGDEIILSWTPVTATLNDGYIDLSNITYTVTRTVNGENPVVIADKTNDNIIVDKVTATDNCTLYRYIIKANQVEQVSDEAISDYVAVGAIKPPFNPDFSEELTEGYFTSKDFLGYGMKWRYSWYDRAMLMHWNYPFGGLPMDAALITAPVRMEGGKAYEISYCTYAESSNDFGVGLQVTTDNKNFTTIIEPVSVNPNNSSWKAPIRQNAIFKPAQDGIYYITFRALANTITSCKLFIGDIKISEGLSVNAPAEVSNVVFKPDYNGAYKLDISLKAPSMNLDGRPLSEITKIDVFRGSKVVYTFSNPSPGQTLTFTDRSTKNEDVSYTITAYNSYGQGRSYYGDAHMGAALPVAPTNCKISQLVNAPGMVKITWTPVGKDIYGNDINPAIIRYAIFASDYETLIEQNITSEKAETQFRAIEANSGQKFVYYLVVPYTEAGVNGYAGGFGTTPMIPVGTPYKMPFYESFSGSSLHGAMGMEGQNLKITSGISSQHLTCGPQDNDNGNIAWYTAPGSKLDFYTANIEVEDTPDVAASFYYAAIPGMDAYTILPYAVYNNEKIPLCDTIYSRDAIEKGWNKAKVSLADFRGHPVQIGFSIFCIDNPHGFGFDNLVVKRFAANDLVAGTVSGPSFMVKGKSHDILVEVINEGSKVAPAGYKVQLFADGKMVDEKDGPAVAPESSEVVKFNFMPDPFAQEYINLYSKIIWNADELTYNNTGATTSISVRDSKYPGVNDLAANLNEDTQEADLNWSEPDYEAKIIEVTESFEDYDPFTIAGFGDWTVKDLDGLETWYLGFPVYDSNVGKNVASYPNATVPKAFMVVDQTQMRLTDFYTAARTGNRSALATSSDGPADDWLISPELPGEAQTVSFFAATAPEDYGPEKFEFYFSMSGNDPDDFIQIGNAVEVPEGDWVRNADGDKYRATTWYEYSYNVPAGTKYFAIRYVSNNVFGLFIDDVTFRMSEDVLALQGYNMYRNGERINESPVSSTSLTDNLSEMESGTYSYAVETVYDKGNSGLSNIESVTIVKITPPDPGSVDSISETDVKIISGSGFIMIAGAEGRHLEILNTSGFSIYSEDVTDTVRVAVTPGIYIVSVDDKTAKVIVK